MANLDIIRVIWSHQESELDYVMNEDGSSKQLYNKYRGCGESIIFLSPECQKSGFVKLELGYLNHTYTI